MTNWKDRFLSILHAFLDVLRRRDKGLSHIYRGAQGIAGKIHNYLENVLCSACQAFGKFLPVQRFTKAAVWLDQSIKCYGAKILRAGQAEPVPHFLFAQRSGLKKRKVHASVLFFGRPSALRLSKDAGYCPCGGTQSTARSAKQSPQASARI